MSRQRWLVVGVAGLAALLAIAYGLWRSSSGPTVNVLLVTLDTTRADRIGCYGYRGASTPTIDRLAGEGVLFERASTPTPLTLPTHATLMTGLLPPEHGLITNGRGRLADDVPTLAATLAEAGYDTAAFVASFVLDDKFGLARGFAAYDDDMSNTAPTEHGLHRQRDGRRVVDSALEWLGQSRRKPFFCWVHLYDPHHPYLPHAEEFGEQFLGRPYDGEIAYVDRQLQRLLLHLDEQGLREQTLIVVVGDHGEGLGEHEEIEHGLTLYENVLRVPWIWAGHGIAAKGTHVPQPVSLADLRPTLLEALEIPDPARVTGRSLRSTFLGGRIDPGVLYAATDEPLLEFGWHPLRGLTTEEWKYIRTPDVELYDLAADPQEKQNLAPTRPEQVEKLEAQLAALEKQFVIRKSAAVELTPAEEKALTSLGYLSGQSAAAPEAGAALPDVKHKLARHNAVTAAHQLQVHGNALAAEQKLQELIAQDPDDLAARLFLVEALTVQQKFDEARTVAEAILQQDPENSDAHFQLGLVHAKQGRFAEGMQEFHKALVAKPNAVGVLYNLGMALAATGQMEQAERSFREALEEDPAYVQAHIALGNALSARRELGEAEQHFREALRYSPNLTEAHANLAILLARQQKVPEAGEHFARAAALAPGNAEIRYNHGVFLAGLGRLDDAIRELEAALRLNPNHAKAAARLEQARQLRGQ